MADAKSCVAYCDWLSEYFAIDAGIRPGCAFSPLAFVLAVASRVHCSKSNFVSFPWTLANCLPLFTSPPPPCPFFSSSCCPVLAFCHKPWSSWLPITVAVAFWLGCFDGVSSMAGRGSSHWSSSALKASLSDVSCWDRVSLPLATWGSGVWGSLVLVTWRLGVGGFMALETWVSPRCPTLPCGPHTETASQTGSPRLWPSCRHSLHRMLFGHAETRWPLSKHLEHVVRCGSAIGCSLWYRRAVNPPIFTVLS